MTTEEKAMTLVNAALAEHGWGAMDVPAVRSRYGYCFAALCRAIEAHEADKAMYEQRISDQAKAFSDAVREALDVPVVAQNVAHILLPFILTEPEPDPLVEVLDAIGVHSITFEQLLAARGYKIERIEQ